ncbi:hypothetical protein, partial [Caballeronia zhejiangensis]
LCSSDSTKCTVAPKAKKGAQSSDQHLFVRRVNFLRNCTLLACRSGKSKIGCRQNKGCEQVRERRNLVPSSKKLVRSGRVLLGMGGALGHHREELF